MTTPPQSPETKERRGITAPEKHPTALVFCLAGIDATASLAPKWPAPQPGFKQKPLTDTMKLAFAAAAAALLAASCCPSAPAPSQPKYVAPSK